MKRAKCVCILLATDGQTGNILQGRGGTYLQLMREYILSKSGAFVCFHREFALSKLHPTQGAAELLMDDNATAEAPRPGTSLNRPMTKGGHDQSMRPMTR